MVLAGVAIEEKKLGSLKALGVKDSKLLSPTQREVLYDKIIKIVKSYKILVPQPADIDKAVAVNGLNTLEAVKFGQLINALKPDVAIIDCPSTNIAAYTKELKLMIKEPVNLRCEHKADRDFPIVAASSILAKVTRDREIEKIKE